MRTKMITVNLRWTIDEKDDLLFLDFIIKKIKNIIF